MTRTFPIASVGFLLTGYSLAAINNGIAYGCDDMDPDFANQAEHGELAAWLYDTAPIEAYLREQGIDGLQCISGVDGSAETFDNVLCGEDGLEVTFDDDLVVWLPMQQEAAWVGKAPYDATDDMVEEFRGIFGEVLPKNFPIAKYICKISGVYTC